MDFSIMDYLKIGLATLVVFMIIKFALRSTQELDHFAEAF